MSQVPVFFHIQRGPLRLGPYEAAQVHAFVSEGRLQPDDLAWCEGMKAWQPLGAVLRRHGMAPRRDKAMEWLVPVNRSGYAIAAGYCALLFFFVIPAPAALVLGLLALRDLKRNPEKAGRGRAWFGVILGGLATLGFAILIPVSLLS